MMGEEQPKKNVYFWIFWIGFILLAYGLVSFSTAVASPEAFKTAGEIGVYGSISVLLLGMIMIILGYIKKK